jgi:hypothetical protein
MYTSADYLKDLSDICAKLKDFDLIIASYSGYGDSGEFDDCNMYLGDNLVKEEPFLPWKMPRTKMVNGKWVSTNEEQDTSATEIIQQILEDILDCRFAGYENDEGGSGKIKINLKTGDFKWTHKWNYEHYTDLVDVLELSFNDPEFNTTKQ